MNRDEKRSRIAALPPAAFQIGGRRVLYPREPSGGTWLAVNDLGFCLALINWHRIEREPAGKIESRGKIIPSLISTGDSDSLARKLRRTSLRTRRPFRLIVIDPDRRRLTGAIRSNRSLPPVRQGPAWQAMRKDARAPPRA